MGMGRSPLQKNRKGKARGMDGIASEMLLFGVKCIVDWLTRVFMGCFDLMESIRRLAKKINCL